MLDGCGHSVGDKNRPVARDLLWLVHQGNGASKRKYTCAKEDLVVIDKDRSPHRPDRNDPAVAHNLLIAGAGTVLPDKRAVVCVHVSAVMTRWTRSFGGGRDVSC